MRGASAVTTARSSTNELRRQANEIARTLKRAERGEVIMGKDEEARSRPSVIFAVAMDDKILKIEMTWDSIRGTTEHGISEYIFDLMRESREAPN